MIQRSAGNPTRTGAKRRYEAVERLEIEPDRDDPHVLVKVDTKEMRQQRRIAVASARSSLLVIGVLLESIHHPWSFCAGVVLLAGFAAIPWERTN